MYASAQEQELCELLRDLPNQYHFRYDRLVHCALLRILFLSLANGHEDYMFYLFPNGPPSDSDVPWSMSKAQGASEGAEYTEAAKGKRCGHIFRNGELTYSCKNCGADQTCVLCARCFEASEHEGHQVTINTSSGSTGCCDCGDPEAWVRPVNCSIHTDLEGPSADPKTKPPETGQTLPEDLKEGIKLTIARALDYICDVFSCSSEDMKMPHREHSIRKNEELSRLKSRWYRGSDSTEKCEEFGLILWNDEKHTMEEVTEQVARACRQTRSYGARTAAEIDEIGRCVVKYSKDVQELLGAARIISEIKVTATIRSSRDIFREDMCGTIIEWLSDISGCSIGSDNHILINTICEEMLKPWRIGSEAFNLEIARRGIVNHEKSEDRLQLKRANELFRRMRAAQVENRGGRRRILLRPGLRAQQNDADVDANTMGDQEERWNTVPQDRIAENNDREDNDDDERESQMDEDRDDDNDDVMDREVEGVEIQLIQEEEESVDIYQDGMEIDDDDDDAADDDDEERLRREDLDADRMEQDLDAEMIIQEEDEAEDDEDDDMIRFGTPSAFHPIDQLSDGSDDDIPDSNIPADPSKLFTSIPRTPNIKVTKKAAAPGYWTERTTGKNQSNLSIAEDFNRRVRIDFLILYDLRMWKKLRKSLRDLYITTVITVPFFKRILGLRFAALYTHLAQLYLVADREPDHSIINLSLQMLTTPSIAEEIVERGKFFTRLLAILYTFLTKRQVGHPEDIDPTSIMALEGGVMTNRRITHFFADIKYLLDSESVRKKARDDQDHLLQFIDFLTLFQDLCPNVRAVGEHIEYESDTWLTASLIVREVGIAGQKFAESFIWLRNQDPSSICRAIRQTAKATIVSSLGAEPAPSNSSTALVPANRSNAIEFKNLTGFQYESSLSDHSNPINHLIVDFEVEKKPMSFHHPIHYFLSFLIDSGKSMSKDQLIGLLTFSQQQLQLQDPRSSVRHSVPSHEPEQYLLALFDIPLRVCAWLAQMRAGMWVRNGITLRHQMNTYRSVSQRDLSYQRDVYLLQVAAVICSRSDFLVSAIDRFGMTDWMMGKFYIKPGFEDHQQVDVAEEFIHLLIVLLSDRHLLLPPEDEPNFQDGIAKMWIINTLCFKPLTYSDLTGKIPADFHHMENFPDILREVASYRKPEGLSDSGTFHLKEDYYREIDPYNAYYSKSQREEAENVYRSHFSRKLSKPIEDVYFEPLLRPIPSGIFTDLSSFTESPIFAQIIICFLQYAAVGSSTKTAQIPSTRVEALLHMVLHLLLIAIMEDNPNSDSSTFVEMAINTKISLVDDDGESDHDIDGRAQPGNISILERLFKLLQLPIYQSSQGRIRFVLTKLREKGQERFDTAARNLQLDHEKDFMSLLSPGFDNSKDTSQRKKQALERQAKVMAAFKQQQNEFLEHQTIDWGAEYMSDIDEDEDLNSPTTKTWSFPEGTCIFCQEETNEQQLYGTLAFIGESNILRQTDLNDEEYSSEIFQVPISLDRSAETIRPFGVAGQNLQLITKVGANGSTVHTQRRVLGKGFPSSFTRPGPVVTGCGHIMHYSCFETYNTATSRRQQYHISRNHPERLTLKEFVCPLCKALGNTFLPIIWNPKERYNPRITHSGSFDQWICAQVPFLTAKATEISINPKTFTNHVSGSLKGNLAAGLMTEQPPRSSSRISPFSSTNSSSSGALGSRWQFPGFLSGDRAALSSSSSISPHTGSAIGELLKAYMRLTETMYANQLFSRFKPSTWSTIDLPHSDTLAKALGFSISSIEIAQRGVDSESRTGGTFLDKIPEHFITHLRIFSETVSSYMVITPSPSDSGSAQQQGKGLHEASICSRTQARQIFCQGLVQDPDMETIPALLSQDSFIFLTECDVYMRTALHLDIHHILRLCYLAEIVKVVVAVIQSSHALEIWNRQLNTTHIRPSSAEERETFSVFVQCILGQVKGAAAQPGSGTSSLSTSVDENPNSRYMLDQAIRTAAMTYALIFLRKSLLLLHIRYGTDFTSNVTSLSTDPNDSELSRLSKILGLPDFDDIIKSYVSEPQTSSVLQKMTFSWLVHWNIFKQYSVSISGRNKGLLSGEQNSNDVKIQLPHPGIFELVALPQTHDLLNTEAMARRCPSTGRELSDPCVCLFCGDIFCGQAQCCARTTSNGTEGGCYQHQLKCGGTTGMFLSIRKCAVVMFSRRNGSWTEAPYLTEHGEPDLGLRYHCLLFLSQKRYDRLFRDLWLSHGIPSFICRKLEADINTGGWETI